MLIDIVSVHPVSELIAKLRDVRMLQNKEAKPYADADIKGISSLQPEVMSPCQCYVLQSEYQKIHNLRYHMLKQHDLDILHFSHMPVSVDDKKPESLGFIVYRVDGGEPITLLPPIIEKSIEGDNTDHLLINDGMHRCYLGWVSRSKIDVIVVAGVPKDYPYYAWPLRGGWRDVQMVSDISQVPVKKYHRVPEPHYKALYRDFNSAFLNVGGPRGPGKSEPVPPAGRVMTEHGQPVLDVRRITVPGT